MTALPPSTSYPTSQRLSPGGIPYSDSLTLLDDAGLAWRTSIANAGPGWVFVAVPSCADIASEFVDCASLAVAVSSCAALRTWGFT